MSGDRLHVTVPVSKVRGGDVIVTDDGIYYLVDSRSGTVVTLDGGVEIDYGPDAQLVVLRAAS